MIGSRNLTNGNTQFEALARATVPGQASWAVGPQTCSECASWTNCGRSTKAGALKPRACEKFRQLMGKIGPAIPDKTLACKFFEAIQST
jgi:hypothetical protein